MSARNIGQPDNPIGTLTVARVKYVLATRGRILPRVEEPRELITFDNSIDPEPESRPFTIAQALDCARRAQDRAIHAELQLQAAQKEIAALKATVEEQEHWLKGETDFELQGFRGGR